MYNLKEEKRILKDSIFSDIGKLSRDEKIDLIASIVSSLKTSSGTIPVSIFSNDSLSTFEALVKYLKEYMNMRYVKIASILNRSDKTIWVTYQRSSKKMPAPFASINSDIQMPLEMFSDRNFTIFESIVYYLKQSGLSNHEIASMLKRDDRTIWSIYDKVKRKRGMKN